MKKILFIALALSVALGGMCFADVQIDAGQAKNQAAVKFFIARNSRTALISADRVVVWDSASDDGISVTTTTTSGDGLVAGITIDAIPGSSSDSATTDMGYANWGRVQTWGRIDGVPTATGAANTVAGSRMCASTTAGAISACVSPDGSGVGNALDAVTGAAVTAGIDIMVETD